MTGIPAHKLPPDKLGAFILMVGDRLLTLFGEPPFTKRPGLEELVLTMLSQNTNDRNRDRAFNALRAAYPSWHDVAAADLDELIGVLRPAGLAPQKAPRIKAVLDIVLEKGDENMPFLNALSDEEAEAFLLNLPGVGIKTAYCTLLFSFERPAFPMDTHVLRIFERIGILPQRYNVRTVHRTITSLVPPDRHRDIHLSVIRMGREICTARKPKCPSCPCLDVCNYADEQAKR